MAAAVVSVATRSPGTFVGSADHLVSEAFYFTDPEGNGVELYADRARDEWRWTGGQVQMDTLRLDPSAFLAAHLAETALGLGSVDIVVPAVDDAGALTERLAHAGVARRDDGRMLSFDNPWDNQIRVTTS